MELYVSEYDFFDGTFRYVVEGRQVTPTHSKFSYHMGTDFLAIFVALFTAFVLKAIGEIWLWWLDRTGAGLVEGADERTG